ncbi:queuosine salvage family protein [Thermomicrobiaceae bacterium CFH 74404]|uniref:Queuosine 5'-phosphate N-glycosylase/hydrolase n=1 Tax=Thermalbibacter longus TaxID=2951981 RepID=A0AA42BB60_9BACT|nr:queuosine salvage family protein [Thermalbibacter longus]MCM8749474.1 queuosine salvage family protein [Thermalbibacter longus]
MQRPDPLGVLETTRFVLQQAQSVHLSPEGLDRVAAALLAQPAGSPSWEHPLHWRGEREQTANYVLVLDALNFCFWPEPRWRVDYRGQVYDGYWALAAALRRAIEQGEPLWDAAYLARITAEGLARLLAGDGNVPLLAERAANLRQVGEGLLAHFGGWFSQAIEQAGRSAVALVKLVVQHFPSFDDVARYRDQEVRFYKRAQLLATDLAGAFRGRDLGEFRDLDQLTAFADYKLPQVLRYYGALTYSPALATRIDRREELPAGSQEEIEIRAATVWAVEELRHRLAAAGRPMPPWQIDWALWNLGQALPPDAPPYHRTLTIFY